MRARLWALCVLAVGCALALGLAPFASRSPDGLETVGRQAGFSGQFESGPASEGPPADDSADDSAPGVTNARLGSAVAGLAGAVFAGGLVVILGRALTARRGSQVPRDEQPDL